MRRLGVLALLLSLTACPQDKDGDTTGADTDGSTGTAPTGGLDEDCAFLPDKRFREDAGYECPLEPGKTCYDQIWFHEATYDYFHYDYVDGGEYACKSGVIDETQQSVAAIGTIHAATGKLTWKQKTFSVIP